MTIDQVGSRQSIRISAAAGGLSSGSISGFRGRNPGAANFDKRELILPHGQAYIRRHSQVRIKNTRSSQMLRHARLSLLVQTQRRNERQMVRLKTRKNAHVADCEVGRMER